MEFEPGVLKTIPVPANLSSYYESDEYVSHKDSVSSVQDFIYQKVKSYMLQKKASWIQNYINGGKILDIGCGTGEFLKTMKSQSWEVVGMEPNSSARKLAMEKEISVFSNLDDIDGKYDVISLWHVLEHLPDPKIAFEKLFSLLKESGLLVIAVPNYKSLDAKIYQEKWAAWDAPRHLYHFSRTGIQNLAGSAKFYLVEEKPLKFDSFYVSLLSEKIKGSNNLLKAFRNGFKSNTEAKKTGEYSSIAYFFKKSE
ncbi:MAG: class I SAM-dependent methyltransferase [Bacteroidota bacterium]|nr:class I SAM-dependent methyltransferase [Bacteroidota bacterium]